MKTWTFALSVALLASALPAFSQDTTSPTTSTAQPSFWQRVGSKTKEVAGAIGKGVRNGAQEVAHPGSTRGDAYRPINPAHGSLENIFPASESSEAGRGQIPWPRIALTVEEYGIHLDCWTFKAKVWTSAKTNHDETFQICGSAPLRTKNALGQEELTEPSSMTYMLIGSGVAMYAPSNTGDKPTEGPNPPQSLFYRDIPEPLRQAQIPILGRLLYVTGFIRNIAGANHGYRMWIAGYIPSGNKG
jgi:hypothetical protein